MSAQRIAVVTGTSGGIGLHTAVGGSDPDPADPYGRLLTAYLRRTAGAFAGAQTPAEAAAVVVEAATTATPRFRWQTSDTAAAFAGLSLADLDGCRVLAQTSTWLV